MYTRILHYGTLKILSYNRSVATMLLYNGMYPKILYYLVVLVPCRSEVHNTLYYTITVPQPCCCTMNVYYEDLALRHIQDLGIRSPYSNHVAVQWDVRDTIALLIPRGLYILQL